MVDLAFGNSLSVCYCEFSVFNFVKFCTKNMLKPLPKMFIVKDVDKNTQKETT